jgi:hypothetical protein
LEHIIASHYVSKEAPAVKEFVRLADAAKKGGRLKAKISVIDPGETLEI